MSCPTKLIFNRRPIKLIFNRRPVVAKPTPPIKLVFGRRTIKLVFGRRPIKLLLGRQGQQGAPGTDGADIARIISEDLTVLTDRTRLGRNTFLTLDASISLEGSGEFLLI